MRFGRSVLLLLAVFGVALCSPAQNVTTGQYGNARTNLQDQETVLQPSNVNATSFGKLRSFSVAGHVYAQPLFMAGLTMSDGSAHNVVFVATEQDNVYAFDADGNNPQQGYLWKKSLLGSGETWVSTTDVHSSNISPDIGITGTPVIDPATNTLYVVAASKTTSGTIQFHSRLHALSLIDGSEKLNGPADIKASVPGNADGGSTVAFSPLLSNQRPALSLAVTPNGATPASVFIAYASHGDYGPYHGWVISYDAADLSHQTGAWCDTPNGTWGGIWMPGGGLASDDTGKVFGAAGNGTFDGNTGGTDFGDSAFALSINGSTLTADSTFTPSEQAKLQSSDYDMGSAGVLLLPTQQGATYPRLAIAADKLGTLFLLNRDNLGGYVSTGEASLQSFSIGGGYRLRDSLAFFNNTLYTAGEGGPLVAFTFDPNTERFATSPAMQTSHIFGCLVCASGGTTPAVSANQGTNGIVWALDRSGREKTAAILHAYDASDLTKELYNSTQAAGSRDAGPVAIAFTAPVIGDGHVFVGGVNSVVVYGELVQQPTVSIQAVPDSIPTGGSSTLTIAATNASQVTVTGSDNSSYSLASSGGTLTVTPAATTTYTATATASNGTTAKATATVSVGVPTITLTALPASINPGSSSTLTVAATNANTVTLTGSDNTSYPLASTGGTAIVTPVATTTYTATAVGDGGQKTASATVTVGPPTVTISAAPASIVPGGSATLTVTSSNATQLTIAGSDKSSYSVVPPGGTVVVTPTATTVYTITATGPSGTATATTSVTVKVPTVSLSAIPASIAPGGTSTLTVVAVNATSATLTASDGTIFSVGPTGGSVSVSPANTMTYTATATAGTQTVSAGATVTVTTLPVVSIAASPSTVIAGASSTLSVSATNATSVTVKGSDGSSFSLSPTGGTQVVTPTGTTTYTATATGASGSVSSATTVTVTKQLPVISIAASPATVIAGSSSTLSVSATNATSVVVKGSDGSSFSLSSSGGTHVVTPAATTTYTASATNPSGTVSSAATVTVSPSGGGGCMPSAAGILICAPTSGSTTGSPVTVIAGARAASGYIGAMRIYSDNVSLAIINNPTKSTTFQISQPISQAAGSHHLVIVAYESTGAALTQGEYITVGSGSGGCSAPGSAGVHVCSPSAGQTVNSPVNVIATGTGASGSVNHLTLSIDGKQIGTYNGSTMNASITLTGGSHTAVVTEVDSKGASVNSPAVTFTVAQSGGCAAPGAPGVHVCSPTAGQTVSSPVNFTAAAVGASGSVNHLELWVDGKKLGNYSGSTMNANVALAAGNHAATIIEVDSKGAYIKSAPVSFTSK